MISDHIKRIYKSAGQVDDSKQSTIQLLQQAADVTLKIFSCAAIIATGIWAYYQFDLKGADDWVVNITIATEILPYEENLRLLVVHIKTKNPTSATLNVEKDKGSFDLIVHKLPRGLKVGTALDEMAGDEIAKVHLLEDDMEMLPNAEFDTTETIVVPAGATLSVTATLENMNGTLTKEGKPDHDFVSASTVVHLEDSNLHLSEPVVHMNRTR